MENVNYMKEALKEAEKALEIGEIPVGAVIEKDGKIIARAHNLKEKFKNPIYHAEILKKYILVQQMKLWVHVEQH